MSKAGLGVARSLLGVVRAVQVLLRDGSRLRRCGLIGLLGIARGDARRVQVPLWADHAGRGGGLCSLQRNLGIADGLGSSLDLVLGNLALLGRGASLELGQRRLLLAESGLRLAELKSQIGIIEAG